jgi:hypothetical protein
MAAKGESSATTDATSTTSGKDSAAATTAETTKKGHDTSLFASPEILTNGTLFYIALSVTCLLWATGRFIDFKTDRLERFTETNVHKL